MTLRAAALALVIALPYVVPPLPDQEKFKSGVDIVRVDALVTDGRKPIT